MPSGWTGDILRVDLSNRESSKESVAPYTRSFIGGRGINVKIVYDEVDPTIEPFDPANRLLFGPGALTGTPAPSAGRMTVTTMCPNGHIGSSSIGEFISAEIKYVGYDNIIIQGKSDNPVYLYMHNDSIEFRDATHVWGKNTWETQQAIKSEIGDADVQVMCVGPAGENLVSSACIRTGIFSSAGSGGFGAIMGSKNLKAIAVRGRRTIEVFNLEEFLKLSSEISTSMREHDYIKFMKSSGERVVNLETLSAANVVALGNWEEVNQDEIKLMSSGASGEEFLKQYSIGRVGCFGCPAYHFEASNVPGTGIGVAKCYGPVIFTFKVWNRDYKTAFDACHFCNQYGLDVISTASNIAFLMELYHRGIISEKDTDGIPMRRGDREAILTTIQKIGRQEGFGTLFKGGVLSAAKSLGASAEECAMHVKGSEMSMFEYRAYKGLALSNAVSTKGAMGGLPYPEYAWFQGMQTDKEQEAYPLSYDRKNRSVMEYENKYILIDMLGVCKLIFSWLFTSSMETPAKLFSLATGIDTSEDDLLTAAQRVRTLERAFDVMTGIRRKNDTLPKRMFETAVPRGQFKGEKLDKKKFDKMVDEYYALWGWDKDGIPKKETFNKFDLASEWQTFNKRMTKEGGAHG